MCNLYSLTNGQSAIRDWFRAPHDLTKDAYLTARSRPPQRCGKTEATREPRPGYPPPIPGMTPAKTGSHRSHVRRKGNMAGDRARASAHHMHQMRHNPAPKPAT